MISVNNIRMECDIFVRKMKKIFLILLSFCYLLSVTGMGISKFYCCGKLKSSTIVFSAGDKKQCTAKMSSKMCCKYLQSFHKINDSHETGNFTVAPELFAIVIAEHFPEYRFEKVYSNTNSWYFTNAPPEQKRIPVFLLNCNFRI